MSRNRRLDVYHHKGPAPQEPDATMAGLLLGAGILAGICGSGGLGGVLILAALFACAKN